MRKRYYDGNLEPEIVTELEKINFPWERPSNAVLLKEWASLLKEFYDANGRLPRKNERFNEINIGNVFQQLSSYSKSSFSKETANILRQATFIVNPNRKIKNRERSLGS